MKNIYNPSLFAAAPPGRGIFYDNFKVHGAEKPCHISLNKISFLGQHRTIPALRLKHRSGSCGTASALPKCS
ncbi:MAG: hypothetical protein WA073_01355, partial [Gemmiger qucibialis]